MTAQSVYFKSDDMKALLQSKNAFFRKWNIQADDHSINRLFTDNTVWTADKKIWEVHMTVNLPSTPTSRTDMVDNTRFNVMTEKEEREIANMKAQQSEAVPMPA